MQIRLHPANTLNMKIDKETLNKIAHLSRLEISESEADQVLKDMTNIVTFVEKLNEVNTDETRTCRYVLRGMLKNQMRDDVEKDLLPREQFLSNAPDQIGGMIRVPPVLKPSS